MMTRTEAVSLAQKLKKLSPYIRGIELFGSIAIQGQGRDADFLIMVDDTVAKQWWDIERESIRVRWPHWLYGQRWIIKKFAPYLYAATARNRRATKLQTAADMLGIDFSKLADEHGAVPDFEMFLVPQGWHEDTKVHWNAMREITDLVYDRNTRGFLERVAACAIPVV